MKARYDNHECPKCDGFRSPDRTYYFTLSPDRVMRGMRRRAEILAGKFNDKTSWKRRPKYRFKTVVKGQLYECRTCGHLIEKRGSLLEHLRRRKVWAA